MNKSNWQTPGTSTFSGEVSDSLYGVTAYAYTLSAVRTSAKKAWFFFDEEVVCLGTDIQSASAAEINTSLNQCLSPEGTNAWLMKFTLGINHGKQPDHGQYAYILVPGKEDAKQVARYQKKKNVEILANTGKYRW